MSDHLMNRNWRPGDLVVVGSYIYQVTGNYLGALGNVSLVGLKVITERVGNAGGPAIMEMFVPLAILNAAACDHACHYREVP